MALAEYKYGNSDWDVHLHRREIGSYCSSKFCELRVYLVQQRIVKLLNTVRYMLHRRCFHWHQGLAWVPPIRL